MSLTIFKVLSFVMEESKELRTGPSFMALGKTVIFSSISASLVPSIFLPTLCFHLLLKHLLVAKEQF